MPTEEMFITSNTSYSEVLDYATKQKIDNATLNQLLWGVLDKSSSKPKRTFSYGEALAATEAGCAPVFARSFVHIDWIDGESVVQAEETSIEEGFNSRFHKIEDDFDATNADLRKLFDCLAELRREVSARLEEVRVELNRINTDIAECCAKDSGPIVPWYPYNPRDDYQVYYPRPYIQYEGGIGTGGPGGNPAGPLVYPTNTDFYRYTAGVPKHGPREIVKPWLSTETQPFEADGGNIMRSSSDPDVAIISGMRGRRISTDTFNGKTVEVWSTPAGLIMTPTEMVSEKEGKVGWVNPHVKGAGNVMAWAVTNAKQIEEKFNGKPFTVSQLGEAFGENRLSDGMQLGAYLDQLPSGTTVKSGVQIAQMVVDRASANVLRDRAADETMIGMVGLNTEASPDKVAVSTLRSVPVKNAAGLERAGVATLADLAKADPATLSEKLGSGVSLETVAGWTAEAMVLSGLMGGGGRR